MSTGCSIALLESALAGNLPAADEAVLNRHLDECQQCGAALERMAGGAAWCREAAAALLASDELDAALAAHPGTMRSMVAAGDEWSEVDFTVEHLEPSDEPNVLGRLGGYDVLEIIGRGGMGIVLKGFDRELQRYVAIKVLAPHLAQSALAKKRFAREAQAAAAVVHPNVLAIHQVQAGGRLPFLVMPLVAGESLAQRLTAQGRLELKETLRIGMQAAAGLAAAHEQGLVHRDVKPANILLEKGVERAVLTDFGLARAADDVTLTRWGIIAGTPQYMSPEQARGEPLDGRSDLFSLGCVLYEMATGVSPFRSESVMATMRRLVDDPPQSMASLNPELPPWFIAIVERLLAKDPSRRFGSAKEVSELLEGCLAHVQQPGSVPLPNVLVTRRPDAFPSRRSVMNTVIRSKGALAMIAVVGAGLLGAFLLAAAPPDIAGQWTGEEWGQVVLKKTGDAEYTGTYSDTLGKQPGEIQLKWSRIERQFNGTWREGEDRFGELSVHLAGDEIRGAYTTDPKSKINPATPHLGALAWTRAKAAVTTPAKSDVPWGVFGPVIERVLPFGAICYMPWLQFRSGNILTVGDGTAKTEQQYDEEMQRADAAGGVDAEAGGSKEGFQLLGKGCLFTQVPGSDWEKLTAEDAVKQLQSAMWIKGVLEPNKKDLPQTWLFKTSRGEMGILELLDIVPDERGAHHEGKQGYGVKLRYKLVQGPGPLRKTGDTGKDVPAPLAITAQGGKVVVDASGSQIVADRVEIGQPGGKTTPATPSQSLSLPHRARPLAVGGADAKGGFAEVWDLEQTPPSAAPDASSPKQAAVAFARAMEAGDLEAARSLAIGTDTEFAFWKSMSELLQASKRLQAAATKRFGDLPPDTFLPALGRFVDRFDRFERLEEKIEGNRATLVLKTGRVDQHPPTLKRVGDGWKMDLSGLGIGPPLMLNLIEKNVKIAKAMDAMAKNLEGGKYKNVNEALEAWRAEMRARPPAPGQPQDSSPGEQQQAPAKAASTGRPPSPASVPQGPLAAKIRQALKSPTQLEFIDTPAGNVARSLSDYHKIPFHISEGVKKTPLTFNLKGVTLGAGLQAIEDKYPSLQFVFRENDILLTEREVAKREGYYSAVEFAKSADGSGQAHQTGASTAPAQKTPAKAPAAGGSKPSLSP